MATLHLSQAKYGTPWTLELGDDAIRATGPPTLPTFEIPRGEAERRITLPSVAANRKTIGVTLGGGKYVELTSEKSALAALRAYFNAALAAAGPEAIRSLRARGWRTSLFGAAMLAGGVLFLVQSLNDPALAAKGEGTMTIYRGLILVGMIVTGQGIWTLNRAGRAARISRDGGPGSFG